MEIANSTIQRRDIGLGLLGFAAILLFIIGTDPRSLSIFMLLIFPVAVAVTSFSIAKIGLKLLTSLSDDFIKVSSTVVAAGSLLVVLLSSLGQLGFQDILLAGILMFGLIFYLKRLQPTNR